MGLERQGLEPQKGIGMQAEGDQAVRSFVRVTGGPRVNVTLEKVVLNER